VLLVPCADDYSALPEKLRLLLIWALERRTFDYLFKCDDDTYVRMDRLLAVDLRGHDYIGGEWAEDVGYASGGAGYLLSRRAVEIVAGDILEAAGEPYPDGAEDLLVGRCLRRAGVRFQRDRRFIAYSDELRRPRPDRCDA